MITTMPAGLESLHEMIHDYETPIIIASAIVITLSWALYMISKRIDCHDHGCHHEPCGAKKDRTKQLLQIATLLFIVNVVIYVGVHRNNLLANYFSAEHVHVEEHSEAH